MCQPRQLLHRSIAEKRSTAVAIIFRCANTKRQRVDRVHLNTAKMQIRIFAGTRATPRNHKGTLIRFYACRHRMCDKVSMWCRTRRSKLSAVNVCTGRIDAGSYLGVDGQASRGCSLPAAAFVALRSAGSGPTLPLLRLVQFSSRVSTIVTQTKVSFQHRKRQREHLRVPSLL